MEVMEITKELLIKNIKRLRKEAGLTQEGFAEKSGISISFLKDIERGESLGTAATLDAIADGFKVPIAELFADPKPTKKIQSLSDFRNSLGKIPDDVFNMAQDFEVNDEVWGMVRAALKNGKKNQKKKTIEENRA